MKNYRIPRLAQELKKIFNITLTQKLNDPALAWVNITEVIISKDLRYAKVYFSHFNNPASHDEIKQHLIKSSGFFKKQIAGAHIMRTIPELSFHYDDTEDRAERVEALLASIKDEYDEDYDPDIDIEDYLDDDEYYDYDDDEEEDNYDDFDDDDDNDR
jgi:ribosome-binding factor A